MMTKEQLADFHNNKHEETTILKQEIEKVQNYSGPLTGDELAPALDPPSDGRKRNRHQRRKLAAVQRAYMKKR